MYRSVDLEAVTCKKMQKIEQNQIHSLTLSGDEKTGFRLAGKGLVCDNAERIRDKKKFTVMESLGHKNFRTFDGMQLTYKKNDTNYIIY